MKKNRILAFDFIKAICAIGIICYHFGCSIEYLPWTLRVFNGTASWGSILVVVFFIVSGALLYYHYSEIESISAFYKKRWLSLFPAFYLAYIAVFFERHLIDGTVPVFQHPLRYYMYSILGIDGYLWAYTNPNNYYILGEWFLGAIIILYCLYPLLLWLVKKCEFCTTALLTAAYILTSDWYMLAQSPFRNIPSITFCFYIGIIMMKHQITNNKYVFPVAVCLFILSTVLPISIDSIFFAVFDGILLFFTLFFIGKKLMEIVLVNKTISFLSSISYEIFLIQHEAIWNMTALFSVASDSRAIIILFLTILCTIARAFVLHFSIRIIRRRINISKTCNSN